VVQVLIEWLKIFWPAPMAVSMSERALSCVGAALGLLFSSASTVGEYMRRQVLTCRMDWPVTYWLQMLANGDVRPVPVLDEERRVVGLISQSDLLAALFRMSLQGAAAQTPAS
jgi:CBS-domain-containing membrane protein